MLREEGEHETTYEAVRSPALTIATAQFEVSGCVGTNAKWVRSQIEEAARRDADVVLFPEAALTGYPGTDLEGFGAFDWDHLRREFESVQALAARQGIWVLVGSAHQIGASYPPTNSVFVITPTGEIETRYDKRRLYKGEIDHYTVGDSPVTFTIAGVTAGVLICYDSCFPELYAELEEARVKILFHAFYNARSRKRGAMDALMPAQIRTRAHDHSYLIVGSNSSAEHSAMPSCIAVPDGRFETLERHVPGVLVHHFPADDDFWRFRREESSAIRGAIEAAARRVDAERLRDRRTRP